MAYVLTRIWPVSEKREAAEKGRDGNARTALPMATFSSSDILGAEGEGNGTVAEGNETRTDGRCAYGFR